MEGRTIERAKIWQESIRKNLGMVKIYMQRSKILPYPPGIIESVLEQICNRILCPVEVVEIWGSGVKTRWNLPIRIGENRALSWDSIQESSCRVILVAGQERQCGVIAWPPCQGGCNRKALVLRMVELRVGRAAKTAQSIEKVSVFIDGATEIERSLDPVIAAGLQLDLMEGFQRGPFTDQVKEPPRGDLSIQHRRGTFEDLDTLKKVRVNPGGGGHKRTESYPTEIFIKTKSSKMMRSMSRSWPNDC
jgi:hypothetical protein